MSQLVADKLLLSANVESLAVSNFHPVIMGIHLVRGKPQLVLSNAFDVFFCCGWWYCLNVFTIYTH